MGTGTLDEALHWIEYCNSTQDTYYANLRRSNGHREPYRVKYWGLGNEVWGPWQVEQDTKEQYAKKAHQWAKAIKLLDPEVELILCGETGHSSWDHHVMQEASQFVDMLSIHIYTSDNEHLKNVTAPLCAERSIQMASAVIDLACVEKGMPSNTIRKRPTICFDEWNVWDPSRAPGEEGAEEHYTLSDALAVGVWLNVFVRQAKHLGMANIAQSVNVISPLMTSKDGIRKQSTWWPLWLFSRYMRGETVGVHLSCGKYEGETNPRWIRDLGIDTPWLDVSAAAGVDGFVNLAVVNIHPDEDMAVDIEGLVAKGSRFESAQGGWERTVVVDVDPEDETAVSMRPGTGGSEDEDDLIYVFVVTGEGRDVLLEKDSKAVGMKEYRWDGKGKFTFTKHSLTLLRWKP